MSDQRKKPHRLRGMCPRCGRWFKVKSDGTCWAHTIEGGTYHQHEIAVDVQTDYRRCEQFIRAIDPDAPEVVIQERIAELMRQFGMTPPEVEAR